MSREDEEKPVARPVIDLNLWRTQEEARQAQPPTGSEAVEAFRDAIAAQGLGQPEVVADGTLHRYDLPNEKRGRASGWYVLYADNVPAGAYGSWKHDLSFDWCSRANFELSREELDAVRERARQAREAREAEHARIADEAAQRAAQLWAEAADGAEGHPYLQRKQVGAFGVRFGARGDLLVPMYDCYAQVRGLQRIAADGTKRFLPGQATSGLFHVITGPSSATPGTVYVCEGYATGASLHMATGHTVVVAFNAGNLQHAAKAAKEVFPQAQTVIAADNDRWTTRPDGSPWNVGLEKARAVAAELGARFIAPEFRDLSAHPTDFNDLHVLEGLEAVRAQAKGYGVRLMDWSLARLEPSNPPPIEWLVEDLYPRGVAIVLAAAGGTGKGMLTLDLAVKVATEPAPGIDLSDGGYAFGRRIMSHGPVVILAAEDDEDEIHRRASGLCDSFPAGLYIVTMPDLDAPKALIVSGPRGPEKTAFYDEFAEQVAAIRPAMVVVDPLSCFVQADANDPSVGAYTMGLLASLARRSNAAVVGVHHFNKLKETKHGISSPEQARNAIRGSTAIVDHARGAYALWSESEDKAKQTCQRLGVAYERGKVVKGCLVKHNYPGDDAIHVFIRQSNGLLVRQDAAVAQAVRSNLPVHLDELVECIRVWAERGQPFTKSGKPNGLDERKENLPPSLRQLGKHELHRMADMLLEAGRVKRCVLPGSRSKSALDVPEGPVAMGIVQIAAGSGEDDK